MSFSRLRQLDLSKHMISDIEEVALHPLVLLENLDISNNKRKTFTGLLGLRTLNLERNIISGQRCFNCGSPSSAIKDLLAQFAVQSHPGN